MTNPRIVSTEELVHLFYFNSEKINISSEDILMKQLREEDFLPHEIITSENVRAALLEVRDIITNPAYRVA